MTVVSPAIPAILEDAGADILMEALGTLGCEYQVEPQCPARSLRWCRVKPDPCPRSVSIPGYCHQQPHVLGLECSLGSCFLSVVSHEALVLKDSSCGGCVLQTSKLGTGNTELVTPKWLCWYAAGLGSRA